MRSSAWLGAACALALGGAVQLSAGSAAAQSCESDADCADGLICKSYGAETCATPAIDCPEGEACPEPAPCEPREIKQCALPGCETDDDCPSGTVCHSFVYQDCSGSSGGSEPSEPAVCPDGEECPQPEQPVCADPDCMDESVTCEEVASEAVCTPVWQLPCTESADCGAGFTCEEQISMWCSGSAGSAGSPTPDDGSEPGAVPAPEPEPVPPECGSEPTGEFYCVMTLTECSTDDDCEAGWSCSDNPSRPVCMAAGEPPASDSGGSGDFAPPAEDVPVDDGCPESTEPVKVCLPPYHDVGGGLAYDAVAETTSGAPRADGDNGAEPPQSASAEEGDDEDDESGSAESDSGGCSVSAAGANEGGFGLSLFGLLGLSALLRRRSRRA